MKKIAILLLTGILIMTYLTLPAMGSITSQSPWGSSSLGQMYRKAAIVGQVISYNRDTDSYIIFGRLSVDNGAGYLVFETRKFYRVYPKWGGTDAELANMVGTGVKMFGSFECAAGAGNEEKLFAEKVAPYDPNTDIQAGYEPAYGDGIGPEDYVGYGVPVLTSKLVQMEVNKSSDVVNRIVELKDILGISSTDTLDVKQFSSSLLSGISVEHERAKEARSCWQRTWGTKWCIEKDLNTNREMQRAVQGTAFIYGKSGGINGYIEKVPVIRPDVDKFMSAVEGDSRIGFEEWAAPAVFYGLISPSPDKDQEDPGLNELTKLNFTGVYYSDNDPKAMVESMAAVGQGQIKSKELWKIEKVPTDRVTEIENKQCWLTGQRVLVYLHTYTDSKGEKQSELVEVYNGRIEDPNYSLVDHFIIPNKIITKQDYNFMISLVREIAMHGGL